MGDGEERASQEKRRKKEEALAKEVRVKANGEARLQTEDDDSDDNGIIIGIEIDWKLTAKLRNTLTGGLPKESALINYEQPLQKSSASGFSNCKPRVADGKNKLMMEKR